MVRVAKDGYKIALKIDPIIVYRGWTQNYENLLFYISNELKIAGLKFFSLY